jgi:regulator of sigma E protease
VIDGAGPSGAVVRDPVVRIMSVIDESPAKEGGLEANQRLVSINGVEYTDAEAARAYIGEHQTEALSVVMERTDGSRYDVTMTPREIKEVGRVGLGVGLVTTGLVRYPFFQAIMQGAIATYSAAYNIVTSFAGILGNLLTGKSPGVDLSGPVGIAVMTGEVAGLGFVYLMQFAAMLSVNLAILNVLPFPALDGGRILLGLLPAPLARLFAQTERFGLLVVIGA